MIGIDTNILLRWLIADGTGPWESAAASEIMATQKVHISSIAIAEAVWVLTKVYKRPDSEIIEIMRFLMERPHVTIESAAPLATVLDAFELHGGDLNDHLAAAHDELAGCLHTVTFDRKAARSSRFRLLARPQ